MKRFLYIFISVVGWMVSLQGCATTSDLYNLEDRMIYMIRDQEGNRRTELDNRITERMKEGRELRDQSASLGANLERVREDLQKVGGRLDESEHQMNGRIQALEASLQALTARLDRLDGGAAAQGLPQPIPAAGDNKAAEVAGVADKSEAELYEAAKHAFDNGELENAKKLFQTYLEKYPKSKEADNAQFWLAESFFRDKWYEKAILEYQKVIENYPKGNKVADSLWKQGLAFFNLNEKVNARLIWEELVKKFPESSQAQLAAQKLKTF